MLRQSLLEAVVVQSILCSSTICADESKEWVYKQHSMSIQSILRATISRSISGPSGVGKPAVVWQSAATNSSSSNPVAIHTDF